MENCNRSHLIVSLCYWVIPSNQLNSVHPFSRHQVRSLISLQDPTTARRGTDEKGQTPQHSIFISCFLQTLQMSIRFNNAVTLTNCFGSAQHTDSSEILLSQAISPILTLAVLTFNRTTASFFLAAQGLPAKVINSGKQAPIC